MQFFQQTDLDKLKESLIDEETGLYNKTALYFLMHHILVQHERYEENYSFIIMDCATDGSVRSNCKSIPQKIVDKVVAEKLKSICRKSDILFRCDNGIFCILARVFEGDDTVMFCEKLTRNLKELEAGECTIEVKPKYGITFSKINDTPEKFAERSYSALKKAKEKGNPIVIET